ncbi:hypothetical protein H4R24_003027 [Coemansia sp. RSA 988]|nr:hypothetical protein H4R24_003027 [Coemansia sp. RSA 988]
MQPNHFPGRPAYLSQREQEQQQQQQPSRALASAYLHNQRPSIPIRTISPSRPGEASIPFSILPPPSVPPPSVPLSEGHQTHIPTGNFHHNTLLPYRQSQLYHDASVQNSHQSHQYQQSEHRHNQHVKLLQSCDSCRRRKIRCSGEKPTCSSCIRYQERCHYSPLATPRRRAGKRARVDRANGQSAHPVIMHSAGTMHDGVEVGSQSSDEPLGAGPSMTSVVAQPPLVSPSSTEHHRAPSSNALTEDRRDETNAMQRDIETLSRKFDSLNDKLDTLIGIVGKRRRLDASDDEDDTDSGGEYDQGRGAEVLGNNVSDRRDFTNLIDKTSRFGLDADNVGVISDMIGEIGKMHRQHAGREQQQQQLPVEDETHAPGAGGQLPAMEATEPELALHQILPFSKHSYIEQLLETPEMQEHLIEMFYANADVNTIAFMPRHIFDGLKRESRTPTSMISVMMADACNYSDSEAVQLVGRQFARGYFIERAYKSLFECLEYDSAEHCVALLLFAMIISKAGLHRAWIMHSLSTQMAIRLRFNTLDSPLSTQAFKNDNAATREWKRRVFWQLYTFDILTSTLSDLPPCLLIHDVRCNAPRPLPVIDSSGNYDRITTELTKLGPAIVLCDSQTTIELQIKLVSIMCDISSMQTRMTPEDSLFPDGFTALYRRIEEWQKNMPCYDILAEGNLPRISEELKGKSGLIFLTLFCQYARILLCLIKDNWLPTQREMTEDERTTLTWTRDVAYESAQIVHRLVPFIRGMRLSFVCPFVSCVVYQACIVNLHSCAWSFEPHRVLTAVDGVQRGLDFLEYVSLRWGFANILTTSLRSLVIERGFGTKKGQTSECKTQHQPQNETEEGPPKGAESSDQTFSKESRLGKDDQTAETTDDEVSLSESMMHPFVEETQAERILRTGEVPWEINNGVYKSACDMLADSHLPSTLPEDCSRDQQVRPAPSAATSLLGDPPLVGSVRSTVLDNTQAQQQDRNHEPR